MMTAATVADGTSTGLKILDASVSDGSWDAATNQGIQTGVNFVAGRLFSSAGAGVVRHLETAGNIGRTGVAHSFGIRVTTTAATDATSVSLPAIYSLFDD